VHQSSEMELISEGFTDPKRYIYDLDDRRDVWFDFSTDRVVRPINNEDALRAINLLKDCFAVESIDGNTVVQRKIKYPNFIGVWSSAQVTHQARFILEIYELLKGLNVNLFDGHPWNIIFEGAQPRWIDLGSLRRFDEASGSCVREVNQYVTAAEFYRIGYCKGFREKTFGTGEVEDMLKGGFESLAEEDPILSYTEKFYRLREREERDRKGTWIGYSENLEILAEEKNLTAYATTLIDVIEKHDAKSMIDLGCNNGQYSAIAARRGVEVLALDVEDALICELFEYTLKQNLTITPVVANLSLYRHANEIVQEPFRATADIILAYAILHHMVHRDSYDFERFFDEIHYFEPKILILSFVSYDDIKFVEPKDRFDWYNQQNFISVAKKFGYAVEIVPTTNTARNILVCVRNNA
jgi:SAM-dependent methyltransferase